MGQLKGLAQLQESMASLATLMRIRRAEQLHFHLVHVLILELCTLQVYVYALCTTVHFLA
jgi:hypothetical protein